MHFVTLACIVTASAPGPKTAVNLPAAKRHSTPVWCDWTLSLRGVALIDFSRWPLEEVSWEGSAECTKPSALDMPATSVLTAPPALPRPLSYALVLFFLCSDARLILTACGAQKLKLMNLKLINKWINNPLIKLFIPPHTSLHDLII